MRMGPAADIPQPFCAAMVWEGLGPYPDFLFCPILSLQLKVRPDHELRGMRGSSNSSSHHAPAQFLLPEGGGRRRMCVSHTHTGGAAAKLSEDLERCSPAH